MTVLEAIEKYAKRGDKFYSTVYGTLTFVEINNVSNCKFPIVMADEQGNEYAFTENGKYSLYEGAERVLFPDAYKYDKDWLRYMKVKKAEEEMLELSVHDHIELSGHQYVITSIISTTAGDDIIYAVTVECKTDKSTRINTKNEPIKKVDKFNIKSLKPFDQVLVRDNGCCWRPSIFGFIYRNKYACGDTLWEQCIPYNNETYGLVGKREDAPKFYRQ